MNGFFNSFPSQKKSKGQKTRGWYKQCVDSADSAGFFYEESTRDSRKNKIINLNLYNGRLDPTDMMEFINPDRLQLASIPDNVQHFPIVSPRIDVLVGEEAKRRFDYKVILANPDSISAKENEKADIIRSKIEELVKSDKDEQEVEKELKKLEAYLKYDFQDFREIRANKILNYLYKTLRLSRVFNEGFKDALIQGEEIYQAEIISNEPYLKKINPLNIYAMRSGFSNKIEDSDLIILDEYWSPGRVIDNFFEDLKPSDITKLERGDSSPSGDPFVDNKEPFFASGSFSNSLNSEDPNALDGLIDMAGVDGYQISRAYDTNGNVRVLRVYWRGFRKVLKVKYYDELGNTQYDYFPEDYVPKKDEGEEATVQWINEWYEGTKIGHDIYVNLRPKPVQYNRLSNPSACNPGFVGRYYSTGQQRATSLLERMKSYQYLYNIVQDRLNRLLAKNKGKILVLDLAMVPNDWEVEQWMHYLSTMNIAVKNSFNEGQRGAALGKMAGNVGRGDHSYIDMDQGQNIQQHIGLLQYIKSEMAEISGVTDQRLGQIDNRETVGGVERSVTQSSHITEWYFSIHDEVKLEAMAMLLETAKIAWKKNKKKIQNILDDHSIEIMSIDGDEFSEEDYGLIVMSDNKTAELEQKIQQAAEMALQGQVIDFKTLTDIYFSNSLAEAKRKIDKAEEDKLQREAEQAESQNQAIVEAAQIEEQSKEKERMLKDLLNQRDNFTKTMISDSNNNTKIKMQDNDNSPFIDEEYNRERIDLDKQKRQDDLKKFNEDLAEKKRQHDDKMKNEKEKLKKMSKTKK